MGISLGLALLLTIPVTAFLTALPAFAQEEPERIIINRVEIWGLFYKGMVIAFTVGALLMGVIAYVVFRFRESNKKNIARDTMEGHH